MPNAVPNRASKTAKGKLLRILGLGFGLAVVVGGTIGVSIFRLPGPVTALLHYPLLVLAIWLMGGIYTLLSANYTAELATMYPNAGGPYVYAMAAFGRFTGFVIAWTSWLGETAAIAFLAIVFAEYTGAVLPATASNQVLVSFVMLLVLSLFNWVGVRTGSGLQQAFSVLKTLALLAFVVLCFVYGSPTPDNLPFPSVHAGATSITVAVVLAFQLVLGAYGGWNTVVYFAEEDTNPARNIPRALQGGVLLVMAVYLLVNAAIFFVLPASDVAASKLAAADALGAIVQASSSNIITILAIISILGIINATLMFVPRVLYAMGRDGFFMQKATSVNKGGTPTVALLLTVLVSMVLVLLGSFERLMAVYAFYAVATNAVLIAALFRLRKKHPQQHRPFRAWGYPLVPGILLLVSLALLAAVVMGDTLNSIIALLLFLICYPIYFLLDRRTGRQWRQ